MEPLRLCLLITLFLAMAVAQAPKAGAQSVVAASPDVSISIGSSSLLVTDESVVISSPQSAVALANLGTLPQASNVGAFSVTPNGDRLFALSNTTELPGAVVASHGDVVRYNGSNYSIEFDASARGVPATAALDAVAASVGALLLSFNTTVELDGVVASDEDLIRWDGSTFSLRFDGSVEGLDRALDLDAAHEPSEGVLLLSFDAGGEIDGVVFADEDILRFDAGAWSMEIDSSLTEPNWSIADIDAVPEAHRVVLLATGVLFLGLIHALRQRESGNTLANSSASIEVNCHAEPLEHFDPHRETRLSRSSNR